jgi:hypothetical protein
MAEVTSKISLPRTISEVQVVASGPSLEMLERGLTETVGLIRHLVEFGVRGAPLNLVLSAATAIIASMGSTCRMSAPPVPIEMTTDDSGNLIYRCSHDPSHSWPV